MTAQNMVFSFHELSEKDGLTQSDKYHFSTDSKGFIWIGSDNGLLRFDGKNLLKFQNDKESTTSIYENRITSNCFEDENNNLWFSSFGALNCYLRQSNQFVHYRIDDEVKNYRLFYAQGSKLLLQIGLGKEGFLYSFDIATKKFEKSISLPGDDCLPIADDNGEVNKVLSFSLLNSSGVQFIDIENGNSIHANFEINTIGEKKNFSSPTKAGCLDNNGSIWFGLYNSLGKYDLGENSGIVHEEREPEIDVDVGWINDIINFKEKLLLVAADKGLLLFDVNLGKFIYQYRKVPGDNYPLNLRGISSMHLDDSGNLLLSGIDQKIAYTNIYKNRFSQLVETSGISFVNIYEDPNGNIWCSALDSGTYVFTAEKELLFHTKRLRNPSFDNGFNPLPEIYYFLKNSENQWWGNIGNYFFLWDNETNEFKIDFSYFLGVANTDFDRINFCYELSGGKNIVARGKDIYELKLSEEKVDTLPWFSLESFDLSIIRFIFQDRKGNIYINDDYGKLLICKINNNYLTLIAEKTDFGILNAYQEDIERDKIWVTGTNGLGYFHPENLEYESVSLSNQDVVFHDVILDNSNRLWLPSNNGLYRYNPETKELHNFNTSDGLLSSVFTV